MGALTKIFLVFLGGGCGSIGRWGLSLWLKRYAVTLGGLPVHTLAANLAGCLLIGLLAGLFVAGAVLVLRDMLHPTTFSTFSLETFELMRSGHLGMAALYLALSVLVCVAGVAIGYSIKL